MKSRRSVSDPMSKDKGLVSGLHRNSAYRARRAALASSLDTSGATDKCPVPLQSCRRRSVRMVMFLDGSPPDFLAHQIGMERVMTVLTDKEQALVGAVPLAGMPAHGASLGGVVSIDFDRHALMQEGFIRNVGVQLGVTPPGLPGIGLALLLGRLFAML